MDTSISKILIAFVTSFFAFLMQSHVAIITLFLLVFINAVAKTIAVLNDDDVRFWQVVKILKRSKAISYLLFATTGYAMAILAIGLLEFAFLQGATFTIGEQVFNLHYLTILLCVSHIIGQVMKSVEDIVEHPMFDKIIDKMPKWLQDYIKPKKTSKKKDEN